MHYLQQSTLPHSLLLTVFDMTCILFTGATLVLILQSTLDTLCAICLNTLLNNRFRRYPSNIYQSLLHLSCTYQAFSLPILHNSHKGQVCVSSSVPKSDSQKASQPIFKAGGHSTSLGLCPTKLPVKWDIQLGQLDVPAFRDDTKIAYCPTRRSGCLGLQVVHEFSKTFLLPTQHFTVTLHD